MYAKGAGLSSSPPLFIGKNSTASLLPTPHNLKHHNSHRLLKPWAIAGLELGKSQRRAPRIPTGGSPEAEKRKHLDDTAQHTGCPGIKGYPIRSVRSHVRVAALETSTAMTEMRPAVENQKRKRALGRVELRDNALPRQHTRGKREAHLIEIRRDPTCPRVLKDMAVASTREDEATLAA